MFWSCRPTAVRKRPWPGWVIAQDIDSAVVLLIPRRADRVLVRRVPLVLGVDEAGLAEITFIIERSLASVLASQPIGVPQAEARAALTAAFRWAPLPALLGLRQGDRRAGRVFGGVASWSSASLWRYGLGSDLWTIRYLSQRRGGGWRRRLPLIPGFHHHRFERRPVRARSQPFMRG